MASIGHVAIGLAGGRAFARGPARAAMYAGMALAILPDGDVIGLALGVPYWAPLGHRGASHSLAFAAVVGLLCALALRRRGFFRVLGFATAIVASHGLVDAMTDGGLGVALLWPFSTARFFLPWRPIPVAPIGLRFVSARGLHCLAIETLMFLPLFVYALLRPRS